MDAVRIAIVSNDSAVTRFAMTLLTVGGSHAHENRIIRGYIASGAPVCSRLTCRIFDSQHGGPVRLKLIETAGRVWNIDAGAAEYVQISIAAN